MSEFVKTMLLGIACIYGLTIFCVASAAAIIYAFLALSKWVCG